MEKPSPNIPPSCPVRLPFEKATGWGDGSSSSGCQSQVPPSIPLGCLGGGRQKGGGKALLCRCLPLGVKDSLNHRKEGGSGACAHYLIFSLWAGTRTAAPFSTVVCGLSLTHLALPLPLRTCEVQQKTEENSRRDK